MIMAEPDQRKTKTQLIVELDALRAHVATLEEQAVSYRGLFERAVEGIFHSNPEGRFTEVNPALVRMLGYTTAEEVHALWLPDDLYIDPTQRETLRQRYEAIGVADGVELQWKKQNGEPLIVSLHARTICDTTGHVVGYEGMVLDITARKRAEAALQDLSYKLLETQESERRHLARELHDEMMQTLTALQINLDLLASGSASTPKRLTESRALVDDLVDQVRTLSLELRPAVLDEVGLVAALDWYCKHQVPRLGLGAHFTSDPLPKQPYPAIETAYFRVVQEAVTNAAKHATAQQVWITLQQRDNALLLTIRDDGTGFDVVAIRQRTAQGVGFGLRGMEERVRLIGGQLDICSTPGHGTEIRARVPLGESVVVPVGTGGVEG
jgi:PAS domain S-box-containing protein